MAEGGMALRGAPAVAAGVRHTPCPLFLGAWLVALLLAGCATSTAPGPQSGVGRGASAGEEGSSPAAGNRARGRGGYYLDDGPGDRDPAELDALARLPDPVPLAEPLHPRANRPYRVMGGDYRPMTQRAPFRQRGTASWYGRKFHGQPTSIGERYDMYGMTAAHPTLPIPSFARVTHLGNGRSVVVRVNDRGPFLHGRAIDLSYLAAHKLGYVGQGQAEVEVELLDPERLVADAATAAAAPAPAEDPTAGFVPMTTFQVPLAAAPQGGGPPVQPAVQGVVQAMVQAGPQPVPQPVSQPVGQPVGQPVVRPMEQAVVQPVAQPVVQVVVPPATEAAPRIAAREGLPPPAAGASAQVFPSPSHYLQLGAFSVRSNAEAASTHLRRQLEWLQVPIAIEPYGALFRVQAGPFPMREVAARAGMEVRARTGLRPLLLPRPID